MANMTANSALRMLESLIRSSDLPHAEITEAEDCLSTLWEHVLLGSRD
jgi:hypothetical protein